MRRAMLVLTGHSPQDNPYYYDHPPFGPIFLGSLLRITGYPDLPTTPVSAQAFEGLYLIPKLWIGILSVIDTFLIYMIAKTRYNNSRIALLSSLLFAVMPMTWLTRRMVLESLLLPFLLLSILFAVTLPRTGKNQYVLVLLSGTCLGIAIFTKIPVFAMIPLVGFLVYTGSKQNKLRNLGIWFAPVMLIPLLWPAQSVLTGTLDSWFSSVLAQTQRQSEGILTVMAAFVVIDPLLLGIGIIGVRGAILKRDLFVLLWLGPFMVFLLLIGYVQYFHSIPVLPVFCISAAIWLDGVIRRIKSRLALARYIIPVSVVAFGLTGSALLITANVTSSQFEAAAFAFSISDKDTTIISNPVYSWPYVFVFDMPYAMNDYRDLLYSEIQTEKIVLISEPHFQGSIHEEKLGEVYNRTTSVRTFYGNARNYDVTIYPYSSMIFNDQANTVEVRQGLPQ